MSDQLTASAVSKVAELAQDALGPKLVEVDGRTYSEEALRLIRQPALDEPAAITVHTLAAVLDFLDVEEPVEPVIHVVDPTTVHIVSKLQGERLQRFRYLEARANEGPKFGSWLSTEEMVVKLQSQFTADHAQPTVLKLVGNVKDEAIRTQADDGATQKVTAKSGVSVVEELAVENPFELAPFRTFPEVEQPSSPFVLRFRRGQGGIEAALFEGDGGAWRTKAITRIADWLAEKMDVPIIA